MFMVLSIFALLGTYVVYNKGVEAGTKTGVLIIIGVVSLLGLWLA